MRPRTIVSASFIAYLIGVPLAAVLAMALEFSFAWSSGFALAMIDIDASELIARILPAAGLAFGVVTWLGLVYLAMSITASRSTMNDRRRSVRWLAALIALAQLLRLARPHDVFPALRLRGFVPLGVHSVAWRVFLSDIPRHPIVLLFTLGALPALAWMTIRRRERAGERDLKAVRSPTSAPPLVDPPATSMRDVALVLGSTVGLFLLTSLSWLARTHDRTQMHFTTARVAATLATEVVLIAIWLPRLRRRWTVRMISAHWRASDALHAILLVLATQLAYRLAFVALSIAYRPMAVEIAGYRALGPLSWWIVVAMVLVNPLFEETLYLGFGANLLRQRFGYQAALISVVLLRLLVHAYQGPLALISVLPLAIIWTVYYLRTGRLWPLVVAHMIFDLMALASIASKSV
jgi:membrane protease YdiL (CAAX protease family)